MVVRLATFDSISCEGPLYENVLDLSFSSCLLHTFVISIRLQSVTQGTTLSAVSLHIYDMFVQTGLSSLSRRFRAYGGHFRS